MDKRSKGIKTAVLGISWCLVIVVYLIRLINIQLVHGNEYLETATKRSYKTQTTFAVRGEILDSEGNAIVTNRMGLSVTIDKAYIPKGEENKTYLRLIKILKENNVPIKDGLPMSKTPPYTWLVGRESDVKRLLRELEIAEDSSAEQALDALAARYEIEGSDEGLRDLAGFRYEIDLFDVPVGSIYTAASDITPATASQIKEQRHFMNGINISVEPIRVILDGTFAPHVIGRTGLISENEAEKYTALGYPLNAVVGKEGVEKAFESYLCGTGGENVFEIDNTGKVVGVHEGKKSKPGNTVMLTIDKQLQLTAQEALESAIKRIRANSHGGSGSDCKAGSVVALNPNTGAVYCMATYPSYDSTTYSEDFEKLANDPTSPLLNRAIGGIYSPGSTFKIATALAGLENGVITPTEKILTKGKYTYYDDYQPMCWIYSSYGTTHGLINVSDAIKTSCNYFFFEVGRRLGIDRLDDVCKRLGLGELTGIEISGEAAGVLASKEYKKTVVGEQWYGGDDLQAAIGQSYNLFTPIQLATYISAVVNGGTRYQAHLMNKILDYNSGEVISEFQPKVLSTVNITDEEHKAILSGMRSVTGRGGTAARAFAGYPINVGGKTGTASVSKGTATGVFVCFAPYEKPEIVICALVEHAGGGNAVAPIARSIMDAYFKLGKYSPTYNPNPPRPAPPASSVAPQHESSSFSAPAPVESSSAESVPQSSAESVP